VGVGAGELPVGLAMSISAAALPAQQCASTDSDGGAGGGAQSFGNAVGGDAGTGGGAFFGDSGDGADGGQAVSVNVSAVAGDGSNGWQLCGHGQGR
jgi:hypothetical protein